MKTANTKRNVVGVLGLGLAALALPGCIAVSSTRNTTNPEPASRAVSELPATVLHEDGRFIIAGQPSEAQLIDLAGESITVVVNARTDAERSRGPFDQAALLDSASIRYVEIPLGGADGYAPEAVDAFAEAVESTRGRVLVHCASGGRARQLYAAYLVKHEGYTPQQAIDRIEQLGQSPTPLERLLGEELDVVRGADGDSGE